MSTPKTEVAELLRSFPDTASYEDIQYHLYVILNRPGFCRQSSAV